LLILLFLFQSAIKIDKGVVGKAGVAQEKDAVPGEEESEEPVSDSSSSSSSSSSSEPMEASDEGRKAEDIPAKEIEDSLHKAEVRLPQNNLFVRFEIDGSSLLVRWCSSSSDGREERR
jgi:hypothetical protein